MSRPSSKRRRRAPRRSIQLQQLEPRHLLAAAPLGATWKDTGEYLLGTVAVTPVFFESNGATDTQSQNWTSDEIQESIDKVVNGVSWWSDLLGTLDTVHSLDFVFDTTFAVNPFETRYEPIDRKSGDHELYVAEFMASQGYDNEVNLENAMWRFNDAQREKLGADWAFTVFVVDASDDPDGQFRSGGFPAAFALPGGLYMVVPSGRSASTIAHELGHIFWAFDEYSGGASWNARRGYYDTQNLNATNDNPDLTTQQPSIMRGGAPLAEAFNGLFSAESTLALVGWQDSDGDGVFDVLDVPLELNAVGYFDHDASEYHFSGTASAVPLLNLNSYGEHPSVTGTNSDITLNRISELQYSLDGGPWIAAAQPDQQVVDFDITVAISQSFGDIRWRAIDQSTGIVSAVVEGTATAPAIPAASHAGFAFIDDNADGVRDPGEAALAAAQITIRHPDGSPLFGGVVDAADFSGKLPEIDGVTLTVEAPFSEVGPLLEPQLRSSNSSDAGNRQVFFAQEYTTDSGGGVIEGALRERWSEREFVAQFDQPVGEVRLDAIGLDELSYGRLEAYDAAGNLITRTTKEIAHGELVTLSVSDPTASIASVHAFGLAHTDTGIAISRLQFGFTDTVSTDQSGAWRIPNLPDGDYIAQLTPQRLIHQFDQPSVDLQISGGTSSLVVAAANRVDSPRHNATLAQDANQDGVVTARDALVIINDLSRNDSRILGPSETIGFDVDVNNDGAVSGLDALLVINHLSREQASAESESPASGSLDAAAVVHSQATDTVLAGWAVATTATTAPIGELGSQSLPFLPRAEMTGSTGRATAVEGGEASDSGRFSRLGGSTQSQEIAVFAVDSPETSQQDRISGDEQLENRSEKQEDGEATAPTFQPIQSEISEPFR